jgi:hypothetical protein
MPEKSLRPSPRWLNSLYNSSALVPRGSGRLQVFAACCCVFVCVCVCTCVRVCASVQGGQRESESARARGREGGR